VSILAWIVLGLVAGWLAGQFMKGDANELLGDLMLGIIGAIVGGFLSSTLLGVDVTEFNVISVVIAFAGACIVIAISRARPKPTAGSARRRCPHQPTAWLARHSWLDEVTWKRTVHQGMKRPHPWCHAWTRRWLLTPVNKESWTTAQGE
jgi:uncharacterized membrane protein YeaQ/YmgE (transglycosylase-associated protein family)